MSGTGHVLHIELGADCARDAAKQLSPRLHKSQFVYYSTMQRVHANANKYFFNDSYP